MIKHTGYDNLDCEGQSEIVSIFGQPDKHRKLVCCCLGELNKCINLRKSGKTLGRMVLNHQDNATFYY